MESIGEKLKAAREEKGYSPDQVARDTNIARRFILAMENEDFEAFPGDTYLIGFLRNYSDYLGLDADRIVNLYRNMKIQEQPIPMEELIRGKRKGSSPRIVLFGLLGVLVLAGAGFGIFSLVQKNTAATEDAVVEAKSAKTSESSPESYEMTQEIVARRFSSGQSILVHMSEGTVPLSIKDIGEKVAVTSPDGVQEIGLGESISLDLTLDGVEDLLVEVQDIDRRGATAVIRLDRGVGRTAEVAAGNEEAPGGGAAAEGQDASSSVAVTGSEGTALSEAVSETVQQPVEYLETTPSRGRERDEVIITSSENAEPFRLNVTFRGYSLVRYVRDNEYREQRYFNRDDTFQLDVNREVMLWVSNAGTFKAQIGGQDVSVGGQGEVAACLIRWEEDEDSELYQLKMVPVY